MITIVGAGLVGSLMALFLKKKGLKVQVYERRADLRKAGVSAGRSINLIVTSRGLYALEKAGLTSEVRELAVPVYGRMIHSLSGATTYQPYGRQNEFNLSISRDSLNRFLISAAEKAGVEFFFDHELELLSPESKELTFKTVGKSYIANYDLLFGADGAGSQVRKNLARLYPLQLQDRTDWLEADYKELTLPVPKEIGLKIKADALHIWPRGDQMMMALANKDGSFTVTLYLPRPAFTKLNHADSVQKLFERQFADAIPLMPNYISEFQQHPQGTLGTVHASQWVFEDSIALIGDAAHAIVPFFGQGMNCGFEDCTTLLSLIEANIKSNVEWNGSENLSKILCEYQENRRPNAKAIAEMALENWAEMRDKVGDSKFLLRKRVEGILEERYPSSYKSRYGLITYTLAPYAIAQKAGLVQDEILWEMIKDASCLEDISWPAADRLIETRWRPFADSVGLKKYLESIEENGLE